MTDEQQKWIKQLQRCTFLPGSFEKRFVRDIAALGAYDVLTEKQAVALARVAWRYRKQRGDDGMARPEGAGVGDVSADLERLRAWNEGKPL